MALPARNSIDLTDAPKVSGGVVAPLRDWPFTNGAPAGSSAVRDMHLQIEQRLTKSRRDKWSPRRTLLFVVGTCGAFWAGVLALLLA